MKAVAWMWTALGTCIAVASCGGNDDSPSRSPDSAGTDTAGAGVPNEAAEASAAGMATTGGTNAGPAAGGSAGGQGDGGETAGRGAPDECTASGDCGGAAGAAGSGGGESQHGPISGTLVWYGDVPAVGVAVVLNRDAVTSTDEQGHFSFPDPGGDYELSLIADSRRSVLVVQGLHTRTPRIVSVAQSSPKKGSASGALTGEIGTSSQALNMAFVSGDTAVWDNQSDVFLPKAGKSTYSANVGWQSADSITGNLVFLVTGAGHYVSFGQKTTTLTTAVSPPAVNVALTAVSERTVTVNTSPVPNNFTADLRVLVSSFEIDCGELPATTSCVVPVGASVAPAIRVTGIGSATGFLESARRVPAAGPLNLALPSFSSPILPVSNATNVNASTEFSWTKPSAGMVSQVIIYAWPYTVRIITTETHATLPDLSKYGVSYSANSSGSWIVESIGPGQRVDDVTTMVGFNGSLDDEPGGWALLDADYSEAPERTFKTAP